MYILDNEAHHAVFLCRAEATCRPMQAVKYLKNYLRSSMKEDRLNGLALLYIHKDKKLDVETVIDQFSKRNRRLDF